MKLKSLSLLFGLCGCIMFAISCEDEVSTTDLPRYTDTEYAAISQALDLPNIPFNYDLTFPDHINNLGNRAIPMSRDMATLGRVLFYDKKLSQNNEVSCASCHDQSRAFADPVDFSEGFEGVKTLRNAFALGTVASMDASYDGGFGFSESNLFWDNRATSIEQQCQMTITDPIEMGMSLEDLPAKLASDPHYTVLFDKAFHGQEIAPFQVLSALSQFVRSMSSTNTKFDQGLANFTQPTENFNNFTAEENRGKALFMNNCSSCHGDTQVRTFRGTASNGLDVQAVDKGIGEISGAQTDMGVFKVPTLRNVALTGPYMHDGRFETLSEVVDHYSTNIKSHANLSEQLRNNNGTPRNMNFSTQDKADLLSFFNTLTDNTFIQDVRFSDPFKY